MCKTEQFYSVFQTHFSNNQNKLLFINSTVIFLTLVQNGKKTLNWYLVPQQNRDSYTKWRVFYSWVLHTEINHLCLRLYLCRWRVWIALIYVLQRPSQKFKQGHYCNILIIRMAYYFVVNMCICAHSIWNSNVGSNT